MTTSRDIETLFDHFGGNAADYQEIGRENEAKTARTRWPLLATLDLAQPTIPEIVAKPPDEAAQKPAMPLFSRQHRRTIPPVASTAARDVLSAARFSALSETPEPVAPVAAAAPTFARVAEPRDADTAVKEAPSILGKLFEAETSEKAQTPETPLDAIFDRLRRAGVAAPQTKPPRAWGSRS